MLDKFKLDLQEKDNAIMNKKNIIGKLEEELIKKEKEMKEKENLINIMKHTLKSSDDDDEDHDISDVLKADNDTFDFAQLELDVKNDIQDIKERVYETQRGRFEINRPARLVVGATDPTIRMSTTRALVLLGRNSGSQISSMVVTS